MPVVLVAVDGSKHSMDAAKHAHEVYGDNADYVLVTVAPDLSPAALLGAQADLGRGSGVPPVAMKGEGTPMPFAPSPDSVLGTQEAVYEHYRNFLHEAASVAKFDDPEFIVADAKHGRRKTGNAIIETAEEKNADVIVMGGHGAGYISGMLLGSVSHYVVHHSPIPVVVVRDADE